MLVAGLLAVALSVQGATRLNGLNPKPLFRATAIRAAEPPTVDGLDADRVWRIAAPITEFLEFDPNEGKAPRFATEVKVAYD